jgi:uncharacterized protein (DUF1499 family)
MQKAVDARRSGGVRRVMTMILALLVVAAAVIGAGRLRLLDIAYERLFGPPDLGAVAFGRLTRRTTPNDALACPPGECGSAAVDLRPASYPVTASELRRRVRRYFETQGADLAGTEDTALHDRFVARTALMRFPDTVDVEIFPLDAEHATLAVYSRSQLGFYDFGTNLRRVRALLEALGPAVAAA